MLDQAVEVLAQAGVIDRGCAGEGGQDSVAIDDLTRARRAQLTNRHTVAGHSEALASVECAHDVATLVPELAL